MHQERVGADGATGADRGSGRPRPAALVIGVLVAAVGGVIGLAAVIDRPAGTEPSDTAVAAGAEGQAPEPSPIAPETPATEAPAAETNGVRPCTVFPGSTGTSLAVLGDDGAPTELGGLEGWWNSTPVNESGGWLAVEKWPQQILDHPATATVETTTGTVLETVDRRSCTGVEDYVPPDLSALAPSTVVVLDALTGEVLAEHPVELAGS